MSEDPASTAKTQANPSPTPEAVTNKQGAGTSSHITEQAPAMKSPGRGRAKNKAKAITNAQATPSRPDRAAADEKSVSGVRHDEVSDSVPARKRKWKPTVAQLKALSYLDARGYDTDETEVAGHVGLHEDVFRGWSKTPAFVDYTLQRSNKRLRRQVPKVYEAMLRRARKGNVNAARLFLERYDPDYAPAGQGGRSQGPGVHITFNLAGATPAAIEATGATVTAAVEDKPVTAWDVRKARKAAFSAELEAITAPKPTTP